VLLGEVHPKKLSHIEKEIISPSIQSVDPSLSFRFSRCLELMSLAVSSVQVEPGEIGLATFVVESDVFDEFQIN
jgi:hypothetical protein